MRSLTHTPATANAPVVACGERRFGLMAADGRSQALALIQFVAMRLRICLGKPPAPTSGRELPDRLRRLGLQALNLLALLAYQLLELQLNLRTHAEREVPPVLVEFVCCGEGALAVS